MKKRKRKKYDCEYSINIAATRPLHAELKALANRENLSVSALARTLWREAITARNLKAK